MADSCVVGVYNSLQEAQVAAHILHRADFPRGQMMLIGSNTEHPPRMIEDLSMDDDSIHDAALGAGVGGILGVLAGVSAAELSGIAILFVAGSVAGGLAGALLGAFVGSLVGWGVHSWHITHYEKYLKSGKALVIAEGDPLEVAHADRILQETDAVELHVHARDHARDGSEACEIFELFPSVKG
jgi:hypothetical protein